MVQKEERIFIDFDLKYFWQWTDFQSYVEALMTFLAIGKFYHFLKKIFGAYCPVIRCLFIS